MAIPSRNCLFLFSILLFTALSLLRLEGAEKFKFDFSLDNDEWVGIANIKKI